MSEIHTYSYICTKKKFTEITQDVLAAMLNCLAVRWGSVVMLWAPSFLQVLFQYVTWPFCWKHIEVPVSGCIISCMSLYHVPLQSSCMSPNEVAEHTNQN